MIFLLACQIFQTYYNPFSSLSDLFVFLNCLARRSTETLANQLAFLAQIGFNKAIQITIHHVTNRTGFHTGS